MGAEWYDVGDGRLDYAFSQEDGARSGRGTLVLPRSEPADFLFLTGTAVYLQVTDETAGRLTAGRTMAQLVRWLGLGRVRKDLSTPLEARADRIWIQSVQDSAVLVLRLGDGPEDVAFFPLGELASGARAMAAGFGRVQVMVFVGDTFLPRATWRTLEELVSRQQAWGGLVAYTDAGA